MDDPKLKIGAVIVAVGIWFFVHAHGNTHFVADGKSSSWDSAVDRSRTQHKPAVVLFTADWCPSCRSLHENVLSRSEIREELEERHTYVVVDLTNQTQTTGQRAAACGVSGIPTLIRYDADGRETARTHGFSPEQMLQWLRDGR